MHNSFLDKAKDSPAICFIFRQLIYFWHNYKINKSLNKKRQKTHYTEEVLKCKSTIIIHNIFMKNSSVFNAFKQAKVPFFCKIFTFSQQNAQRYILLTFKLVYPLYKQY